MLEDESGRIKLVGERLKNARLVTGIIMGALGMETSNGGFEVVDLCFAEIAPQTPQEETDEMDVDTDGKFNGAVIDISKIGISEQDSSSDWVAVVSGLSIGSPIVDDAKVQMLVEYLTGEAGGIGEQKSSAQISRLIVAGNSLVPIVERNDTVLERRTVCTGLPT